MTAKVDIWNLALSNIGHRANITDPDEASVEAKHCRVFYPIALGVTLERYAWSSATRREALTPTVNDLEQWAFAYALPNDCVKMRLVLPPGYQDDTGAQDFDIEDNIIYTNVEQAIGKFTYMMTNTARFSPMMVAALGFDLGALLVGPIPKDPKLKQAMTQQAAYYVDMAQAADANASKNSKYSTQIPSHLAARNA
jgi:hypothetical protein